MFQSRNPAILWAIPVLFVVCLVSFPAQAKYSGGTGEPNDPYRIATAADLIALGEDPSDYDKHFLLTADIDLDPNLPGRKVFDKAVIAPASATEDYPYVQGAPFTGVFDGNGHRISHLTIAGESYLGLFGYLASGAEVKDIGVVDVNMNGSGYVAGLVGDNAGDVTRCYATGAVTVAGLVGVNWGAVNQCYNAAAVSGGGFVGGLVGWNTGTGTVVHCYSTGPVSGTGQYDSVGGLVAYNSGEVTDCYSTGAVSGSGACVGGLVGGSCGLDFGRGGPHVVIHCFWDVQASGQTTSVGGTGKTTTEMQDIETYLDAGWDWVGEMKNGTSEIWQMPEGGGYPALAIFSGYTAPQLRGLGTPDAPYLISNALELGAIVYYNSHAHYRLAAPIDLLGIRWGTAVIPWFAGTFDGNGHTLSHLTIQGGGYLGLFGQIASGAEVKDLGVVDVNIVGSGDDVAGLVGESSGAVTDCYSTGTVSGNSYVGGLVGYNHEGAVTKCYSTRAVRGNDYVGGLVGYNRDGAVTQCYSTGAVSGDWEVGGLVGENYPGTVTQCYSTGAVSGWDDVGGLVGFDSGTVTQCYSTGAVSGTGKYVGGLVGVGWAPDVIACFWDTETSGQAASAGGTGKTTAEMQTAKTFLDAGWDFVGETKNGSEDVWWIDEGKDYPKLWWEPRKYGGGTGEPNDPYLIYTARQMNAIGAEPNDWDKHFKLMADIDLSGFDGKDGRPAFNIISPDIDPNMFYYQGTAFTGVFDGGGHKLSHLTIKGASYVGLFAQLASTAVIHDLWIEDVNVTGSGDFIAALAAESRGAITHCYSTGVVNATGKAQERAYNVGGLIASGFSDVTFCHSTATVIGGVYVGGLMGSNWGIATQCYSSGSVRGGGSVGGCVGENLSIMTRCYALGSVEGETYVGGLVGENYQGQVDDCYSTGAVSGNWCVGGLLGQNGAVTIAGKQAAVTRCYSAGPVKGQNRFGGLVGWNDAAVTDSFWDTQTSGQTTSAGGLGRTTAEMQTAKTFLDAGWDFVGETANGMEDVWWINEGKDYSRLWWELIPEN